MIINSWAQNPHTPPQNYLYQKFSLITLRNFKRNCPNMLKFHENFPITQHQKYFMLLISLSLKNEKIHLFTFWSIVATLSDNAIHLTQSTEVLVIKETKLTISKGISECMLKKCTISNNAPSSNIDELFLYISIYFQANSPVKFLCHLFYCTSHQQH